MPVRQDAQAFDAFLRPRWTESTMARSVFINLPVSDLERSKAFFTAL